MEHAFRRIKESSESEWIVQRIASFPDYYIRLARYSLYRRLLFQIIEANHPRYRVTDEDVEEILKDEVRQTLMAKRAEGERTVSEEEVNAVTQALKHYNPDVFEKTHSQLTLDRIYALVTEQLPHKVVKMPIEVFHERYYALAFQLNAPL
jgi:nitric oxide reductase large subunit